MAAPTFKTAERAGAQPLRPLDGSRRGLRRIRGVETGVDPGRKQQILAAEDAERLKRALADRGVYLLGDLHPKAGAADFEGSAGLARARLEPPGVGAVEGAGGPAMTDHPKRDADCDTPHAVHASREAGKPDQLQPHAAQAEDRQEALIDEGLEETFPASDPVSAKRIT